MRRPVFRLAAAGLLALAVAPAAVRAEEDDLSYRNYPAMAGRPIACLYAYAADKTGDHAAAVDILEDCVRRGNVWAMIWLSMLYDNGSGVPQDPVRSSDLMRRAAAMQDAAGYAPLARYHWGMALYRGYGVERDPEEGIRWLRRAADEGVPDAREFLETIGRDSTAPQ